MVTPSRALGALLISPLCIPDKGQGESSTFKEEVELLQERHIAGKFSGLNPEWGDISKDFSVLALETYVMRHHRQTPTMPTADVHAELGEPAVSGPCWEAAAESSLSHLGQELMGRGAVFNKKWARPSEVTQLKWSRTPAFWPQHYWVHVWAVAETQHLLANPICKTTKVISGLVLGY